LAWDRYAYGFNNPVNTIDPTGHKALDDSGDDPEGVVIDQSFSEEEQMLILQVLNAFIRLVGGTDTFYRNFALSSINKRAVNPKDYAFYNSSDDSITLPYGWHTPSIYQNPIGGFVIIMSPVDIGDRLGFPSGTFQTDEISSQFVFAHEVSHSLISGNQRIIESYTDNVDLPMSFLAGFDANPLISRNSMRSGFSSEVCADSLAAYLYAPTLLNQQMNSWIQNILPEVLR